MKKIFLIFSPLLAGVFIALARYNAVTTAVNTETGIPTDKAALAWLFGVAIAICAIFLFGSVVKFKGSEIDNAKRDCPVYKSLGVIAALLLVLSGVLSFVELARGESSVLILIMAIFAVVCGACIIMGIKMRNNYEVSAFLSVIPVFFAALKLLMFYRGNNSNPLIYSYSFELFAFLFAMFSFYSISATYFGKMHPRRIVFFSTTSIFLLATVILSDTLLPLATKGHLHFTFADIAIMAAFLLCNASNLLTIKSNKNKTKEY